MGTDTKISKEFSELHHLDENEIMSQEFWVA